MILLNLAGSEAIEKERSFVYAPEQKDEKDVVIKPAESRYDPTVLLSKFTDLCSPRSSVIMERHLFNTRNQKPEESINSNVADLRIKAVTCKFGALHDELMRDRIVTGTINNTVRKALLKEVDLSLDRAIRICQVNELSDQHVGLLTGTVQSTESENVEAVSTRNQGQYATARSKSYHKNWNKSNESINMKNDNGRQHERAKCNYCGTEHAKGKCPAYHKQCSNCQRWNHFARVCRTNKSIHVLEGNEIETTQDNFQIDSVDSVESKWRNSEMIVEIEINNIRVKFKLDTGAKCNVMSKDIWNNIRAPHDKLNSKMTIDLIAFGGSTIKTESMVMVKCKNGQELCIHIVDRAIKSLLGLQDCIKMGYKNASAEVHEIKSVAGPDDLLPLIDEFKEIFDEKLGKLPVEYKIRIDSEAIPVVNAPRKIPVAMKDSVKKELDRMVNIGVIAPVTEATDWVNSMVATRKKNKEEIRLCLDPRNLNKALKRPHYPMRTVEEILTRISKARYFSVLDAKSSFWQIPLEINSSYYTTFNSPFGRFRFLRMPFGISSGSEVCQQAMEHLFTGYPCEIIMDDLLVWGETQEEHDMNLRKVFARAGEIGLKLNPSKCKFRLPEVGYIGHVLTSKGLKPDPEKTQAIIDIPHLVTLLNFSVSLVWLHTLPNSYLISAEKRRLSENY